MELEKWFNGEEDWVQQSAMVAENEEWDDDEGEGEWKDRRKVKVMELKPSFSFYFILSLFFLVFVLKVLITWLYVWMLEKHGNIGQNFTNLIYFYFK